MLQRLLDISTVPLFFFFFVFFVFFYKAIGGADRLAFRVIVFNIKEFTTLQVSIKVTVSIVNYYWQTLLELNFKEQYPC